MSGRANQSGHTAEGSSYPMKEPPHAPPQESCEWSRGPKLEYMTAPFSYEIFNLFFYVFLKNLHAFIFLLHVYYGCHDQHEHHCKTWTKSRAKSSIPPSPTEKIWVRYGTKLTSTWPTRNVVIF